MSYDVAATTATATGSGIDTDIAGASTLSIDDVSTAHEDTNTITVKADRHSADRKRKWIEHDNDNDIAATTTGTNTSKVNLNLKKRKRSNSKNVRTINGVPVIIDPITSLQDAIDGLSLAMFEALRGLRDAVAPESGNLQQAGVANTNDSIKSNDVDEIWMLYCQNDPTIVQLMEPHITQYCTSNTSESNSKKGFSNNVLKRDEFIKLYHQMQKEKDTLLVEKLANDVLQKSFQIDIAVDDHYDFDNTNIDNSTDASDNETYDDKNNNNNISNNSYVPTPTCSIPGMHRTRAEQMEYIEELIKSNATVLDELQSVYTIAQQKQRQCHEIISQLTSKVLGIDEY